MADDSFGPELFHYTNAGGLRGIFESGTMYATRYDRLNDSTEVSHFRDILINLVVQRLKEDQEFSLFMGHEQHAEKEIRQLYEMLFGTDTDNRYAVPYITSFCSHHGDHVYEQENGLLSQWRGYGGNEKYALVFDTAELMKLAQKEYDAYEYTFRAFFKVTYDDEARAVPKYTQLVQDIVELMRARKNKANLDTLSTTAIKGLTEHSPIFKHRGFWEEREVRMVYAPATEFVREIFRRDPSYVEKPLKNIFNRSSSRIPTINIFEGLGLAKNLPLRRIIVGPSSDQEKAVREAEKITGGTVKLTRSQIPFRQAG